MNKLTPKFYKTREDGVTLYITKSPYNKYIIQVETGIEYDVAIDVFPLKYTYIESDKDIEAENNENI
jgi:hypothetical protein